jgi:shikimate dehydrogenase
MVTSHDFAFVRRHARPYHRTMRDGPPTISASRLGDGAQPLLLGLIGHPIKSSAAPAMHEAAARACGLAAHYRLIDVADAGRDALRAMIEGVRLLGFAGVNVTFPYKEAAVGLVDELAPMAAMIGAINTVVVSGGRLIGHNTDAIGFAVAIGQFLDGRFDATVALIGAGGVGRAIGVALADLGVPELRIVDSDPAKAAALAARLAARTQVRLCASIDEALKGANGVINATPVGMLPDRHSPVPAALLHDRLWVADVVYTPLWTPLLRSARAAGAAVMTGRELCLHQAVAAFQLFSGQPAPLDAVAAAFDAVMARRDAEAPSASLPGA